MGITVLNYKKLPKTTCEDVELTNPGTLKRLRELHHSMVKICQREGGIGLAAPQLGLLKNFFVFSEDNGTTWQLCINPQWKALTDEKEMGLEGCLSIPGQNVNVYRSTQIEAEWETIDDSGKAVQTIKKTLVGFPARVFQHESDHLFGITILNRTV